MSGTSRRRGDGGGFTLIELLVVISIIVTLMTMIYTGLSLGPTKAREVRCLANLKQIGIAIVSYTNNSDGFLPSPAHIDTIEVPPATGDLNDDNYFDGDRTLLPDGTYFYKSHTWRGKILPYVGTVSKDDNELFQIFRCPFVRDFRGHHSFYGMQAYLAMYVPEALLPPPPLNTAGNYKATQNADILVHARTFLVGENNEGHWAVKPKYPRTPGDFKKITEYAEPADYPGQEYEGEVYARHTQRSTWLYADTHAEALGMDKAHETSCLLWLAEKP
jgi:prepilin-type N-terminal cleavage/methylation domain-containing protein